jgi:hypothetical protein
LFLRVLQFKVVMQPAPKESLCSLLIGRSEGRFRIYSMYPKTQHSNRYFHTSLLLYVIDSEGPSKDELNNKSVNKDVNNRKLKVTDCDLKEMNTILTE